MQWSHVADRLADLFDLGLAELVLRSKLSRYLAYAIGCGLEVLLPEIKRHDRAYPRRDDRHDSRKNVFPGLDELLTRIIGISDGRLISCDRHHDDPERHNHGHCPHRYDLSKPASQFVR